MHSLVLRNEEDVCFTMMDLSALARSVVSPRVLRQDFEQEQI